MNKREIQKTIKSLRSTIDKLEKQLKETPKVKKDDKPKSYYCRGDGFSYVPDPNGVYYSAYSPTELEDKKELFWFEPCLFPDATAPYRYTRLPKEKVYKGADGRYYRLNPKGNFQWNSPRPGCKDSDGEPFDPYLRDPMSTGDGDPVRFYSLAKKPAKVR